MVNTLEGIRGAELTGATKRLHLHFFSSPKEILGEDGRVTGLRIERTELDGSGGVTSTGEIREFPVQAVYRAIGYFGSELDSIPFDHKTGVITNAAGRVLDENGEHIPGVYATGWIKRGPIGLIGHTKSDAMETIACVMEDKTTWWQPANSDEADVVSLLNSKGVQFLGWPEWLKIDATEKALGAAQERERVKLVEREDFLDAAFKKD
jgi:ferredoxin--NADP+ reductase